MIWNAGGQLCIVKVEHLNLCEPLPVKQMLHLSCAERGKRPQVSSLGSEIQTWAWRSGVFVSTGIAPEPLTSRDVSEAWSFKFGSEPLLSGAASEPLSSVPVSRSGGRQTPGKLAQF